jgi:hypothetical protein
MKFHVDMIVDVDQVWIDDGFSKEVLEESLVEWMTEEMISYSTEGEVTISQLKITIPVRMRSPRIR